jgi:hypothetical protein
MEGRPERCWGGGGVVGAATFDANGAYTARGDLAQRNAGRVISRRWLTGLDSEILKRGLKRRLVIDQWRGDRCFNWLKPRSLAVEHCVLVASQPCWSRPNTCDASGGGESRSSVGAGNATYDGSYNCPCRVFRPYRAELDTGCARGSLPVWVSGPCTARATSGLLRLGGCRIFRSL